jgi:hypothetical protein
MALVQTFAPHDEESGFGYYRRLAAANALWGWRELAGLANVARSRGALLGRPEHVARELGLELRWAQAASRQEQRSRGWRGLHRATGDALCPACLTDEVYLRREWEHAYVTACPLHHVRLVDRCEGCGELLSPNRERIEQCPCGHDLRALTSNPATGSQVWLSALIASDGVSSGGVVPKLHRVDIAALCELAAVLCLYADPSVSPPRRNAATTKSVGETIEFLAPLEFLLADWPRGFETHVAARIAAGDPAARTLNTLLGRWYFGLKKACKGNPLEIFLEAVVRVAADTFDGVLGLDTAKDVVAQVSEYVLLTDAAKALGVSRDRLLKAAKFNACASRTRRFGTRGLVYEIPRSEVERIRIQREAWVSEAQACDIAQVPAAVLQHMVASKVISTDARWRNDIWKGGPIERQSLLSLFDAVHRLSTLHPPKDQEWVTWAELTSRRMGDKHAIQAVMQAAAAGALVAVVRGRHLGQMGFLRSEVAPYFGTPVLEAGMSMQQLAKFTGWKWESIAHWVSLGLLESQKIMLRGQPCQVVSPQQLLVFRQTYVPLADLAKAMGTRPSALAELLAGVEIVGAKPLPNGFRRGGLIRMRDLGLLAVYGARLTPTAASYASF